MENKTLTYYDTHVVSYASSTIDVDLSNIYSRFLAYMPDSARILDFGCGSGRDTRYFLSKGFNVDAIDGSVELCKLASEYTGTNVKKMLFSELDEVECYDGIWACASILHLPKDELLEVMKKMLRATKEKGHIYTSFKHGDFEGNRGERYYTDFTEHSFRQFAGNIPGMKIVECWMTGDARFDRGDEKWLNLIIQKSDTV